MGLSKAILLHSKDTDQKRAVDLLAYGSTVFPSSKGILNIATARLLELGVEFAVAARRCFEVDGSKPAIITSRFPNQLRDGLRLESDLRFAFNGLVHARNLEVHFCQSPDNFFVNEGNVVALHFVYETDRVPKTYVEIFGMAWSFLTFGPFAWDMK